ncbi:MAG: hypothetical protein WC515_06175 [Candidatus Omnitrophota bacterium]
MRTGSLKIGRLGSRLLALSLSAAVSLSPVSGSYAASSNGTRLPPGHDVELGYEFNMIFDRPLDRSYGTLRSRNHFYTVSFGVADWLSLDGKIGIGDATETGSSHLPKLEFDTGFAGGYGFRFKVFDSEKYHIRVIAGFQHISVHPQDRSAGDDKYESFLDDWQVSGLIAGDIEFVTLYAGIKGSDCEMVYKVNGHDKKRRYSEDHVGLISGAEIYLFDGKARLSVEGRFFDETALSVSSSYLF